MGENTTSRTVGICLPVVKALYLRKKEIFSFTSE